MNENSRYLTGVDVGTANVRGVIARLDNNKNPIIVAASQAENSGMRKGVMVDVNGPSSVVDRVVADLEKVSGYQINTASISINGSHLLSNKVEGMIALASSDNRVLDDDVDRLQEVATLGKIPANRDILDFIPYSYILDGQGGIADPVEMTGSRLEVRANVISSMMPHLNNIEQMAERADLGVNRILPSVMAAATAVLTEKQRESGVAVIDLGASTTSVAVYEDGFLQYLRVIPIGGMNITNDLAICLKITPDIAEDIKIKHAVAIERESSEEIVVKKGPEHYSFSTSEIDEIVAARLEEIFEEIRRKLKEAGFDKQLPSGAVLVGGGANMKRIAEYSKKMLELASRVGGANIESVTSDEVKRPEYAAAVGLMLEDIEISSRPNSVNYDEGESRSGGFFAKLFGKKR